MNKITKVFILIAVLYLLPSFFQFDFDKDSHITSFGLSLPRILSGDTPHHLLMVHSLVLDKDFDLKNNLENSMNNKGGDAGYNQTGKDLPTFYYDVEKNIHIRYKPKNYETSDIKIYCSHPPGIAVFSAFFLWPLGKLIPRFWLIEPGCVFLSIISMLIGLFYFYKIILYYSKNEKISILTLLFFAFGTPLWHYALAWQIESFIAPFFIISYYFFIIKEKNFLPGILLAILLSMRFPVIVAITIFFFYRLFQKKYLQLIPFLLPSVLTGLLILFYHYNLYANPMAIPQAYYFSSFGNPLTGILGSLFSPVSGLLTFSPFLIFSFFGIKDFYKKERAHTIFILILIVFYSLVYTIRGIAWEGGSYSNRYLVPVIPFLGIFFAQFYTECKRRFVLMTFYFLLFVSIFINLQGAFLPPLLWAKPFWNVFSIIFSKFNRIKEIFLHKG